MLKTNKKICRKCRIEYSNMWNLCLKCGLQFFEGDSSALAPADTCQNTDYIFHEMEHIIEKADTLFLYLDKELRPIMCNKAIEDITGYSREEIFGDDWLKLIFKNSPSRKEIFKAVTNSCLNNICSRTYEGAINKKDGGERVLSWKNSVITGISGSVSGILCTAQDITEYRISEYNIAVQSERLRNIFASIKDYGLVTTNLADKVTYYGPSTIELFGWEGDMTLKDISILFSEQDAYNIKAKIKDSIGKYGRFEEEVELLRKDSEKFPATLMVNALVDNENLSTGYVYIIRDITERKKLERQMIQSEKMAAIGQLAAGVAHEMNNPLLVILGRIDMMDMEGEKDALTAKHVLDIVRVQAERMRVIVDRLLSYSRQRASRMDTLDVNDVLKTVLPLVAYHPEFKRLKWKEELEESLPKIKGDFNQLQELFFNIALNACQATPAGGSVTVISKDTKDGFIEIAVEDTGVGIKETDIKKLFTPFFTTKDTGTGLGLAISQSIVSAHGGKIEVESEPGEKSVFKIRLPVKIKE